MRALLLVLLSVWNPYIDKHAAEYDVNPDVIRAIIWVESYGDPDVVGGSGERGLMQIMPGTAQYIENCIGLSAEEILTNPIANIHGGVWLYSIWYHRFGSVDLALSAYNGGALYVIENNEVNPVTKYYVWKVREVLGWNVPSAICQQGVCLVEDAP